MSLRGTLMVLACVGVVAGRAFSARGASQPTSRAAHREGILSLITVVVAWGLTWPVNKVIIESLSPLWMMALRSAIATVALFAIAIVLGRLALPPRTDVPVLLSITLQNTASAPRTSIGPV